jgi:UDP-N-acetylglucosamine 2-epimerase (non-hydrolysing)
MKIFLVAGTRPNFMKIAPLIWAITKHNASIRDNKAFQPFLAHTGQHYDYEMSQQFFQDLLLPQPDVYLGVGSGTHAEQTGRIMIELEKILLQERPQLVVVVGDVNSTIAGALVAAKLGIPVAHIEAGLRSFDRTMPEEINRTLTDAISDYLFTTSIDANENLIREGIQSDKIYLVGNVMVDSLLSRQEKTEASHILSELGLTKQDYAVLTLHRPSNVDEKDSLAKIIETLQKISKRISIVFPTHPRTKKNLERLGLTELIKGKRIHCIKPLGYIDFLKLMMNAKFVATDSGGIQAETTVLGVPCLTLRETTENPITVTQGTNTIASTNPERIIEETNKILDGKGKKGKCPPLWDGMTAERIINILADKFMG